MREQTKRAVLAGGVIGFLVAGTLALPSVLPPALADEEPARTMLKTADEFFPQRIDADTFAKPQWTVEPWVSTEILEETVVRKIGYGRTSFVTINRTASGTYSSDGLASPHILYPGIVRESEPGWYRITVPYNGGRVTMTPYSTCVYVTYGKIC